jgi:hypothetical protein
MITVLHPFRLLALVWYREICAGESVTDTIRVDVEGLG